MNGKNKCKLLKEIRKQIAAQNDIAYVTSECKYKGDCSGTCPKCESEVRYLEEQLRARQKAGKVVAVAGIAAALMVSATGCDLPNMFSSTVDDDVPYVSQQETVAPGGVPQPEDSIPMGTVPADTTSEEGVFVIGEVPYDAEDGELWGYVKPPEETELMGDITVPTEE